MFTIKRDAGAAGRAVHTDPKTQTNAVISFLGCEVKMAHSPPSSLLVATEFPACGAVDPRLEIFLKWKKPDANAPIGGVSLAKTPASSRAQV